MLHGNEKVFSNRDHSTKMSLGQVGGENKQTKKPNNSDSVKTTYFSLLEGNGWDLLGCVEATSPFKGFIPAQSWSWGGLLDLLSLEGKGHWGQA